MHAFPSILQPSRDRPFFFLSLPAKSTMSLVVRSLPPNPFLHYYCGISGSSREPPNFSLLMPRSSRRQKGTLREKHVPSPPPIIFPPFTPNPRDSQGRRLLHHITGICTPLCFSYVMFPNLNSEGVWRSRCFNCWAPRQCRTNRMSALLFAVVHYGFAVAYAFRSVFSPRYYFPHDARLLFPLGSLADSLPNLRERPILSSMIWPSFLISIPALPDLRRQVKHSLVSPLSIARPPLPFRLFPFFFHPRFGELIFLDISCASATPTFRPTS